MVHLWPLHAATRVHLCTRHDLAQPPLSRSTEAHGSGWPELPTVIIHQPKLNRDTTRACILGKRRLPLQASAANTGQQEITCTRVPGVRHDSRNTSRERQVVVNPSMPRSAQKQHDPTRASGIYQYQALLTIASHPGSLARVLGLRPIPTDRQGPSRCVYPRLSWAGGRRGCNGFPACIILGGARAPAGHRLTHFHRRAHSPNDQKANRTTNQHREPPPGLRGFPPYAP